MLFGRRSVAGAVLSLCLGLLCSAPAIAQVSPDKHWKTLETERFYIHYEPELEEIARRAAVQAETAYAQLSKLLKPPRGKSKAK